MKTSKSPLQQTPSCSMFFGFLILFAHGTLGEEMSIKPTIDPTTFGPSTVVGSISDMSPKVTFHSTEFPTKKLTKTGTDIDVSSEAHPVSKLLVATSSDKETTPVSAPSLEPPSTPTHFVPDPITERREVATLKQTKLADTTADIHTSANRETATTVATTPDKTETTKVVGKSHTTVGESTSFRTTAATVGSVSLKPRSTKRDQEKSTTPGQRVQGDPTAHDTSSRRPETQYTTGTTTTEASEADTGVKEDPQKGSGGVTVTPAVKTPHSDPKTTASTAKDTRAVTVAIVLSILLLLVLLIAILLCLRRRRHSGSTSFKMAGWAGQAALPDDSGLDKEVEQGAPTTGEGETRRGTLTTFFGKRQSRVPSVAMEEVVQKETGDVEEAQHLIDGDASSVSSLEGSGEANGKLPEPTVQHSQEKEFPPPPANQEETPPTQLE